MENYGEEGEVIVSEGVVQDKIESAEQLKMAIEYIKGDEVKLADALEIYKGMQGRVNGQFELKANKEITSKEEIIEALKKDLAKYQ